MDPPAVKSSSNEPNQEQVPSFNELLSDAKLVADAAKSTLNHETDQQIDQRKLAGATANLLGAASDYGKLQDEGYGTYVEMAEDYLHQYVSSNSTTTVHVSASTTDVGDVPTISSSDSFTGGTDGRSSRSGGGFGDSFKIAEGFLKKK